MCSECDLSTVVITDFEKPCVNQLLNDLSKIFFVPSRYHDLKAYSSHNLDDPDEKCFSDRLREAAMKTEPLCITPTGLKSPTNDSNPPSNRQLLLL